MYEEFFIGEDLRPHLTTYAITHTWVCALLSLAIGMAALSVYQSFGSGRSDMLEQLFGKSLSIATFEKRFWLLALMNWLYFNFFEFARKTFASKEEKDNVPSYSKIFSIKGAALLSFSQMLLATVCWIAYRQQTNVDALPWLTLGVLFCTALLSIFYVRKNTPQAAGLYRAGCGVILLLQYIVLIFETGRN